MRRQNQRKKDKTSAKPTAEQRAADAAAAREAQRRAGRREMLMRVRNWTIAVVVAGGAGWYVVEEVRATAGEHDLSRIGNGIASVVQIHDPQCPKCLALQREARDAMDAFDAGELQYLVANIRSDEGRRFASSHRVGHVTLVLFDAKGKRREVLPGPNTAKNLERVFRRHLARAR